MFKNRYSQRQRAFKIVKRNTSRKAAKSISFVDTGTEDEAVTREEKRLKEREGERGRVKRGGNEERWTGIGE